MDTNRVPRFHNEPGVARIRVGVKEFMCIGALPPFDHPHILAHRGFWLRIFAKIQSSGKLEVRILSLRYSSSRRP
jgi:hypothetical protein